MKIVELYSNRGAADAKPDVWIYDSIPKKLRIQVRNLMRKSLGLEELSYDKSIVYKYINKTVSEEHGLECLGELRNSHFSNVESCIEYSPDLNLWLDVVTLAFRFIDTAFRKLDSDGRDRREISFTPVGDHQERCLQEA